MKAFARGIRVDILLNTFHSKHICQNIRNSFSDENFKIPSLESERTDNFTSEKYCWLFIFFFFANFISKKPIEYGMVDWKEMG